MLRRSLAPRALSFGLVPFRPSWDVPRPATLSELLAGPTHAARAHADHDPFFSALYEPFEWDAPRRYQQVPPASREPAPHVQLSEDGALVVEMDLPGFKVEEVKVAGDAAKGRLSVTAERPEGAKLRPGQARTLNRAYRVPAEEFDLTKVASKVEDGVLTITVPKVPEEKPTVLFDGAPAKEGQTALATTASNEAVTQLSQARWPPELSVKDTETSTQYNFSLPKEVTKENLSAQLRGRSLVLQVQARYSDQGMSRSVSYSQALTVPAGTTAAQIRTAFEPGSFTVTIEKAPKA